jgi:hypothetical protein
MSTRVRLCVASLVAVLLNGNANAKLIDRGNGLVYDDSLNITWLQNANYAASDLSDRNWPNQGIRKRRLSLVSMCYSIRCRIHR